MFQGSAHRRDLSSQKRACFALVWRSRALFQREERQTEFADFTKPLQLLDY
jgi:hypothetical protein